MIQPERNTELERILRGQQVAQQVWSQEPVNVGLAEPMISSYIATSGLNAGATYTLSDKKAANVYSASSMVPR